MIWRDARDWVWDNEWVTDVGAFVFLIISVTFSVIVMMIVT